MKSEWERPDTIDSVEKFSEQTDQELQDLIVWAEQNECAYVDLRIKAQNEINRRQENE